MKAKHAIKVKGVFLNRNRYILMTLLAGLMLCLCPSLLNTYQVKFLSFLLINIIMACSWNLIGGFCNYFSFGHGVFFGIGAYAFAIAWGRFGIHFYLSLILGGMMSAGVALLISPILRLKGLNFALATLALLEAVRVIFQKWVFTRGLKSYDAGWKFNTTLSDQEFYYLIVLVFILMQISLVGFMASRYGFASAAFKEDELMAKGIGINTTVCKILAFILSAFWVGVIGAIYAPMITYISTQSIFGINWSVKPIVVSIFGGIGSFLGPIFGGIILNVIDHFLWERFLEYHTMIYGILLIAIVLFLPKGLMEYKDRLIRLFQKKKNSYQPTVDLDKI